MVTKSIILLISPPFFHGGNFEAHDIRMTVHLEALDLWEAKEKKNLIPELLANSKVE